jgi:RNA polymerase sigma-70 factor (ECF subfamily)
MDMVPPVPEEGFRLEGPHPVEQQWAKKNERLRTQCVRRPEDSLIERNKCWLDNRPPGVKNIRWIRRVPQHEAAARLYREFGPAVYRRCLKLLRGREAAQDATQEVFVRLMGNMARLEGRGDVLPWIYRVTTNHCLNVLRDVGRRGEGALPLDLETDERSASEALPERRLAHQILQRFDASTQAVVVGVIVDGMEHEEVAATLGISKRTVSRKLERFLSSSRRFMGRDPS